jgi:hypothetical protein
MSFEQQQEPIITGRHGFSATLRNYSITMTTEIKTIIDTVRMHYHETPPYEAVRLLKKQLSTVSLSNKQIIFD